MFIEDPHFKLSGKISHGFFGRKGGVSDGLYESLNVGLGTKDERANVMENRARVVKALGGRPENLLTLHQVHSPDCLYVTEPFSDDRPEADAMVTEVAGLVLGVLTADCVPVLFYGEKEDGAPVIGAAHAGWGGALKGVLQNTVKLMREKGALHIRAVIGPCIQQTSYEVSDDFMAQFIEQDADNQQFFMDASRTGHQMFNLPAYAEKQLEQAGIDHVANTGIDTYSDKDGYFSYRRATHRKEPDYGRQISAIMIKT